MKRALVIADDLTGAAEIAGIGHRYGLATTLLRSRPQAIGYGLTVIDTDSRLLDRSTGANLVANFTRELDRSDFDLVYKKTDSVLRGNIAAELGSIMREMSFA